ncbi:MAG: hypothetical protein ABDH91_08865 [Bacteroidia bacterium]
MVDELYAKNLGYPIDSPEDEMRLVIDPHGDKAYIVLNDRPEGIGEGDIYEFRLWPELRPAAIATYVKGQVVEAKTGCLCRPVRT